MPNLFDSNYRYTEMGQAVDQAASLVLADLFKQFCKRSSPREVSKIMQDAIRDLELEFILNMTAVDAGTKGAE